MKKGLILFAVLVITIISFVLIVPVKAGVTPVIDNTLIAQQIKSHVAEISKMVEQINHLKMQYDQLQQTYTAMTGTRNLGDVLNNPLLRNYIPAGWKDVYSSIKDGGYAGLTGAGKAIRDSNKVFDICAGIADPTARKACERQTVKAAQDAAFTTEAYDKTKDRLKQIEDLMRMVNTTTDQKGALEAIARLQAEQAMIQNEMTRIQLYKMLAETEEKLIAQQQKEIAHQQMKKTGFVDLKPVDLTK